MTTDELLLADAYHALVQNCVYQQSSDAHKQGLQAISAIARRLQLTLSGDVVQSLETLR